MTNKTMDAKNWDDISLEQYRTYVYPNNVTYTINRPKLLHVKAKPEGHSHRVVSETAGGNVKSHYVPAGWIAIEWETVKGAAPFQFLEAKS